MTDQPEYTETIEPPTDQDISDFIEGGGEQPNFHTILEIWKTILAPAEDQRWTVVTPQYANKITSKYSEITFADMNDFRNAYFDKVLEFAAIVDAEIESDEECLKHSTPEEDVEHNSHHYRNILMLWQLSLLQEELSWDCESPDAAIKMGTLSEVHEQFFGPTGLTAFLDNIKFQYTEADQADLRDALEAMKAGRGE